MAIVIAFSSLKGGVGKSTLSLNVAACLHRAGHRTLIVDADPQGTCAAWSSRAAELEHDGPPVVAMTGASLRRDLATRTASIHASAGGGLFGGMEAEGGMSADLRALIAAESSLLEEASALKRQASGVARGLGGGLGGAGMGALATGGTVAARG